MLNRFFPKLYVKSIFTINYDKLLKLGINSLIFDIDNTLVPYDTAKATKEIIELFDKLKDKGFSICLMSNNKAERVNTFNEELKLHNIPRARKPSKSGIKKAMQLMSSNKSSTCLIGDQVFTDIWCGNRSNIYTILVKPVSNRDEFTVRLKRGAERIVINIYKAKIKHVIDMQNERNPKNKSEQ